MSLLTTRELNRLNQIWESFEYSDGNDGAFRNNKRLAWEILGCSESGGRQEASEFWDVVLGDDHEPAWDDDFLEGFAEGAIDVFLKVDAAI